MEEITVLVPVYKGSHVLTIALDTLVKQSYRNFQIIVGDDNKNEDIEEINKTQLICKKYRNVQYIKTPHNLGCQGNFQMLYDSSKTPLVTFLAQDDVFSPVAVEEIVKAFQDNPKAAFITRPYFWFDDDPMHPVRHVPAPDLKKNVIINIRDEEAAVTAVFGSIGQISALALRKKYITEHFHSDIFPGHMYPIAEALKKYEGVFLYKYIVAVGIRESQSRKISAVYDDSPTGQWIRMFKYVYKEKKYNNFLELCIKHISSHAEGLIQIKNYGKPGLVLKESLIMIRAYPRNLISLHFYLFFLIALFTPRFILRKVTDWYKINVLAKTIPLIEFRI